MVMEVESIKTIIMRVEEFQFDASVTVDDYVLGTDVENNNATRSYRIGDLLALGTGSGSQTERTLPLEGNYLPDLYNSTYEEILVSSNVRFDFFNGQMELDTGVLASELIDLINRPTDEIIQVRAVNTTNGEVGYANINLNNFSDTNVPSYIGLDNLNGSGSSSGSSSSSSSGSGSGSGSGGSTPQFTDINGNPIDNSVHNTDLFTYEVYAFSNVKTPLLTQEEWNLAEIAARQVVDSRVDLRVPYVGATQDVDLGDNRLKIGNFFFETTSRFGANSSLIISNTKALEGAVNNVIIGNNAAENAIIGDLNTFIGRGSAQESTFDQSLAVSRSTAIGSSTLFRSVDVERIVAIGDQSGGGIERLGLGVFIGASNGISSSDCTKVVSIGSFTGQSSTGNNCVYLGDSAGVKNEGDNVLMLGAFAGSQNTLNPDGNIKTSVTVINNSVLPSYLNRAAAVGDLTVSNGCVSTNTYLYFNETTFAVEGVRL